MRYLHLVAAIVCAIAVMAAAAKAQTYIGTASTVGTQWQAQDINLAGYIADGYGVVAVTQQLTQSDRGIVNLTSYFLQNKKTFVRCNELTVPTMPAKVTAARKTKPAPAPGRAVAPTVILGCAKAVTPSDVPLSRKAGGIDAILSGH